MAKHRQLSVSDRVQSTEVAVIDDLLERYGDAEGLINLAPGVSAWKPSSRVFDAISSSLRNAEVSAYGDVLGWPLLRKRWLDSVLASWDKERLERESNRLGTDAECDYGLELMVTAGANQGFFNVVLTLCDPGDEVILLLPYYFSHYNALVATGVVPVLVPCDPATLLPKSMESVQKSITSRTKALVLVNPANPSGVVAPPSLVDDLVSLCSEHGIWIIIDEAYNELTYGIAHYSPAVVEGVIKLYTMSKLYGMAGWRVGAIVYPKILSSQLRKVQDTIPTHAPIVSQIGAYHCLAENHMAVTSRTNQLFAVRERIVSSLSEHYARYAEKFTAPFVAGCGAFYFFIPTIAPASGDSVVDHFFKVGRVLVAPGRAFGMPGYVRISYGKLNVDNVDTALAAIKAALEAM